MNKAVANVLNRVLGDWVKDLNSDQLNLSIFSGEISLENLSLKEDILHILGFPFDLSYGSIGKIKVKIPWSSLFSSSLSIEVLDVYAYLTPKKPQDWKEEKEKAAMMKSKESALAKFEAMNSNELKDASSPGYFAGYATTIVNNIQISIKNIYIRYEDTISSSDSFAVGLSFKELTIQTCNSNWKPEYVSEYEICYKLIRIESFKLFCDFNVPIVKFQETYKGDLSKKFQELCSDDLLGKIEHNFILKPFTSYIKIKISTKTNYTIPQFEIEFNSSALFLDFYSGQIKLFLKFGEFMKLYNVFKAGVEKSLNEKDLDDLSAETYMLNYKKWKEADPKSEEYKISAHFLDLIEKDTKLESLKLYRTMSMQMLERQKTVEAKKQKIDEIKNESAGTFSRMSGYVFGKNNTEKEREEREKKMKLDSAQKDLEDYLKEDNKVLQMVKSSSQEEKDWNRYKFDFIIEKGGFSLFHEKKELIKSQFDTFQVLGRMKEGCMSFELLISSYSIRDKFENSKEYPYLFESKEFRLNYIQNPMKVSISSGDVYIVTIYSSIMHIANIFKEAALSQVDVKDYVKHANDKFNKYVEDGREYVKGVIKEGASPSAIELDLQINAPKVIIPTKVHGTAPYIVLDLGKFECVTSASQEDGIKYDEFYLTISDLEMYIVWNWESIKTIQNSSKDYLLSPVLNKTTISKAVNLDFDKPGFKFSTEINKIELFVNEKKIKFLLNLQKVFKPSSQDQDGSSVKSDESQEDTPEESRAEVYEKKPMLGQLSNIGQMVPIKVSVVFKSMRLVIKENDNHLCSISQSGTGVILNIDKIGNISAEIYVLTFNIADTRETAAYKDIVRNPYLDQSSSNEDTAQLRVLAKINPTDHKTDIGVVMNSLRFMASKDFVSSLLDFYTKNSVMFSNPVPKETKELIRCYNMDFNTYARYTINLKTIELQIPLDSKDPDSISFEFNLSLTVVYVTRSLGRYTYTVDNILVERKYEWCNEEAYATLSNFQGYLAYPNCKEDNPKNFISPCRFSVDYVFEQKKLYLPKITLMVRIESLCVTAEFKDLDFFNGVAADWGSLSSSNSDQGKAKATSQPKTSENTNTIFVSISGDAVQLTLVDDVNLLSLIHLQFSNMEIIYKQEINKYGLRIEVLMFLDYFNKNSGAWEPVLEDWKVTTKYVKENDLTSIIVKSSNILNFNLTYYLIDTLAVILHKLKHKSEKQSRYSLDVSQNNTAYGDIEYEIRNNLDLPLIAWIKIGRDTEKWKILDTPQKFSQAYIDRLHTSMNKKCKRTSIMNTIQAPTKLEFSFNENLTTTSEVIIETVATKVLKAKTPDFEFVCLVEVSVEGGKRIISFNPSVYISNYSDYPIALKMDQKILTSEPNSCKILPLSWGQKLEKNIDSVYIGSSDSINENTCSTTLSSSKILVHNSILLCQLQKYKFNCKLPFTVIEVKPLFFIKNKLHNDIQIIDQSDNLVNLIQPGEEINCEIDLEKKYKLCLTDKITGHKTYTDYISLFNKKEFRCDIFDNNHVPVKKQKIRSSIVILSEKKTFRSHKNFSSATKINKNEEMHTWSISIFSDYIFVNKTGYNLLLSDLEIPKDQNKFYSGKVFGLRLKMRDQESSWSNKFKIETIGTSEVIKVALLQDARPKQYLFGVSISQAPSPLLNTKTVTFTPRFMIWNFLDIPITIKQANIKDSLIYNLSEHSGSNNSIPYQFDDYSKSKGIVISDSNEQNHLPETWSGPFGIENIDDFQVKFLSKQTEVERKMNIFQKGWHIPRDFSPMRYVRVFVHSQDDATVHITFLDPKDADYRIVNRTKENFVVRQKDCNDTAYSLNPESTINWVWDNNLIKDKKVEIIYGNQKKYFSLEKIEKSKILKEFEIRLQVNRITRELTIVPIGQMLEVSIQSVQGLNFFETTRRHKVEKAILERQRSMNETNNQNINLESILGKTGFLKLIKTYTEFSVQIRLSEIGLSVIDQDSNELFYIYLNNLLVKHYTETTKFGTNLNIQANDSISLEHFQIDYMGDDERLFPVILSPIRHTGEIKKTERVYNQSLETDLFLEENFEEDREKYYFFRVELDKQSSYKLKKDGTRITSMDKFDNFLVSIQEIQLKLNEEIIYHILKVKDFFNPLYSPSIESYNYLSYFESKLPEIPFDPSSFQLKAYFRQVRLWNMKILLTFEKALGEVGSGNESNSGFFVFSMINKLGGAFANVSESPFAFNEIIIFDAFQTLDSLTWILIRRYMQQGFSQFYKIFGSIDIIGNPLGLIESIGKGVYEFVAAPVRGAARGPGGFVQGLDKGVKALVSGVVGGGFGSISKISDSLYNVLRATSGEDVLKQEINTENIGKNMAIGFKDGLMEVVDGIGGIVVKPYRGAGTGGTKGFFKGLSTGTMGLVSFPLKVALKFSSVISTTIASTSILIAKGKIKKYGRKRFPRHFGAKMILEQYDDELAEAQALLQTLEKYKKERMTYYSRIVLKKSNLIQEEKNIILLLTSRSFLYILDGELYRDVKINHIIFMELHVIKRIYFLCIASKKKNFSIPSTSYSDLACVYNAIESQNDKLPNKDTHKFETPSFVNKLALGSP